MNQRGLKKNLNHHRDTDPNVNNNHSFDLKRKKQKFTNSTKQRNHINNNNDFSIELKCEVEEQDCDSLHLDSEVEINSNVKESKGQLKSKSQLNKLEDKLKFNGKLRLEEKLKLEEKLRLEDKLKLEEKLKLKCKNSSKEVKINDIDTQGDLNNCLNGKDSFENACNHSPTRDSQEKIPVDLFSVSHDNTILNSFERKLKSLNVPTTKDNEHTNTNNIHNVDTTNNIHNDVDTTNNVYNVDTTNNLNDVNNHVVDENVEIKPRKRGRKPKIRRNISKYKLNDVKKIVSDINGTKPNEDEQLEENLSNPNESIEYKNQKIKNETDNHRKKRTYKKRPKLGEAINLFNKVTRRSESIYEMQLRMAIEMSMKDCKSYEFQEDYKQLDIEKVEETEGNDDKDSEYEESKPKKNKKMVKKVKNGNLKVSKKRSKKSESTEVSTPKSENNVTSVSSIEYLNTDSLDSRFENCDSNCLNDSQDDKDIDKTVVPSESVQVKESDETVSQAKMTAFEEYLSMCERFYCGKSLDDDIAQVVYETDIKNTVKPEIKKNSHSQTKKYKDSDSSSSSSTNGFNNSEEHLNDSKGWKEKPQDDRILSFNCSRLDLVYRVSFNILKSSLRQPEVIDLWGPKEVVLFELGLFKYGKEFHEIQKDIPNKSVKEIVDMYYLWKKSNRYKLWKANRYY